MVGLGAIGTVLAGFDATAGDSHARHEVLLLGFVTQQTEHVHESVGGLNFSPNPEVAGICKVAVSVADATS